MDKSQKGHRFLSPVHEWMRGATPAPRNNAQTDLDEEGGAVRLSVVRGDSACEPAFLEFLCSARQASAVIFACEALAANILAICGRRLAP